MARGALHAALTALAAAATQPTAALTAASTLTLAATATALSTAASATTTTQPSRALATTSSCRRPYQRAIPHRTLRSLAVRWHAS